MQARIWGLVLGVGIGIGCGGPPDPQLRTGDEEPVEEPTPPPSTGPWKADLFEDHETTWTVFRGGGEAHATALSAGRKALAAFGAEPGEGLQITYSKADWPQLSSEGRALRVLHPIPRNPRELRTDEPRPRNPRVVRRDGSRVMVHYAGQSVEEGWLNTTPIGLSALVGALTSEEGLPLQVLDTASGSFRFADGHEIPGADKMAWLCPEMLGWRDAGSGLSLMLCGEGGQPVVYEAQGGGLFLPFARLDARTRRNPQGERVFTGLAVVLKRP